jgi:Transposase DDE domain
MAQNDREAGEVPHTSIDTEAHWTKSGWHGWVYGWKLHLATTVAGVWIPLAARLTPANEADSRLTPRLLEELPEEARFVLGDTHYNAPEVHQLCESADRILVASGHRGAYPHTDAGVEVRRIFHELRSRAIENFRTGSSRASSTGKARYPPKGLPTPLDSRSEPSSSIS